MSLNKLKSAPVVLIEDYSNNNILPLLLDLVNSGINLVIFCYEQPIYNWRKLFKDKPNRVTCYEVCDTNNVDKYIDSKCIVIIDSVIQMALSVGWNKCLKVLSEFSAHANITQLLVVYHLDCMVHLTKWQLHLNHLASAVVSYVSSDSSKIKTQLKKGGKLVKLEESLIFDSKTNTLKSSPIIIKEETASDIPERPHPGNLSTFKIEIEQTEKLEKYKLKLPYMNKIHEGQSKIHYEPDAVDDWDDEDPDEDLDI